MNPSNSAESLNIVEIASHAYEVGRVALDLARIDRATALGTDGVPESDADHTVSVALVAIELAQYNPQLDVGRVAVLALAHDVVEIESGDTQTFYPDASLLAAKKAREDAGYERIQARFGEKSPWLLEAIDEYELGETLEAGHVQLVDKLVRSIAHTHDGAQSLIARGVTVEQHDRNVAKTNERMQKQIQAHPIVAAVWQELTDRVRQLLVEAEKPVSLT